MMKRKSRNRLVNRCLQVALCSALAVATLPSVDAQRLKLATDTISFYSEAPVEDIEAINTHVTSLFEPATGHIAFSVPMRSFEFPKKLMQEHFNDKYLETDKYPSAFFSGSIVTYSAESDAPQKVVASGKLTIHGVTRDVEIPGTIQRTSGGVSMNATFMVKLEDYEIEIPQLLWQNIAEEVKVSVMLVYEKE